MYCDNLPARELPSRVADALSTAPSCVDETLAFAGVRSHILLRACCCSTPTYSSCCAYIQVIHPLHRSTQPSSSVGWVRHHCPIHQHRRGLLKFSIPRPDPAPRDPCRSRELKRHTARAVWACWWAQRATLTCHQQSAASNPIQLLPAPAPTGLPSQRTACRGSLVCFSQGRRCVNFPRAHRFLLHHHLFSLP